MVNVDRRTAIERLRCAYDQGRGTQFVKRDVIDLVETLLKCGHCGSLDLVHKCKAMPRPPTAVLMGSCPIQHPECPCTRVQPNKGAPAEGAEPEVMPAGDQKPPITAPEASVSTVGAPPQPADDNEEIW